MPAKEGGRATTDGKKKGCHRTPRILARGKEGDTALAVREVIVV